MEERKVTKNETEELKQQILTLISFHNVNDGLAESVSNLFELFQAFPDEEAEATKSVIKLDHKKYAESFFDESIRVESLIHIGTQCTDYSFPALAEKAFDEDWDEVWAALGVEPYDDDLEKDQIAECLIHKNKLGFLIQFATPVPKDFTKNGYSTSGWGYYTMKWIYSESLEDAYDKALKWREEYIEGQRPAAVAV